ncbi:hypothetical protein CRENBAI_011299 [Crenichthys baileyi]|uniref:Uncharacterized protein n=1 Tax=Crenichthys baileyi TaxID=28760 RepID=A0AAV9QP75_9TELE
MERSRTAVYSRSTCLLHYLKSYTERLEQPGLISEQPQSQPKRGSLVGVFRNRWTPSGITQEKIASQPLQHHFYWFRYQDHLTSQREPFVMGGKGASSLCNSLPSHLLVGMKARRVGSIGTVPGSCRICTVGVEESFPPP